MQLSRWQRTQVIERGRIDTREHFADQLIKDRIVKLVQCRTNKMVADALTKNLSAPAFEQHRATMLGEDEAPFSAMMCRVEGLSCGS